jgi:hypothetical protein
MELGKGKVSKKGKIGIAGKTASLFFFFFLVVLEFELKALHLLILPHFQSLFLWLFL